MGIFRGLLFCQPQRPVAFPRKAVRGSSETTPSRLRGWGFPCSPGQPPAPVRLQPQPPQGPGPDLRSQPQALLASGVCVCVGGQPELL